MRKLPERGSTLDDVMAEPRALQSTTPTAITRGGDDVSAEAAGRPS